MSFSSQSRIEVFRLKRHGAGSRLRFLKDGQAGYLIVFELSEKFYLNRRFSSEVGARIEQVTFDAPPNFDESQLDEAVFCDLVKADDSFRRYRLSTTTKPTALTEVRFRLNLTAVFGDETPITEN